jgi:hypothetical protein
VYLFPLADRAAFKVGFSCQPLQRIHCFSRRYFERFDLAGAWLLGVEEEAQAREVEALLKTEFADRRVQCPSWVSSNAGGHTEWFDYACLETAEQRFADAENSGNARRLAAPEIFRRELLQRVREFEIWAWRQAQLISEASRSPSGGRLAHDLANTLRDWTDAYRHFDIALFEEDQAVRTFVAQATRFA